MFASKNKAEADQKAIQAKIEGSKSKFAMHSTQANKQLLSYNTKMTDFDKLGIFQAV